MFLQLLVSIFGFVFVFRIFLFLEKNYFWNLIFQKDTKNSIFLFVLFSILFFSKTFGDLLKSLMVLTLVLASSLWMIKIWIKNTFEKHAVQFLNLILLNLQMGYSFRISYALSMENQPLKMKEIFKIIIVQLDQEFSEKNFAMLHFSDFFEQMRVLSHVKMNVIDQVKSVRDHRAMILKLKNRSLQISKQVLFQALILFCLYISLFVFICLQFSISKNKFILTSSLFLYFCGVVGVILMGGKRKWKV